VANVTFGSASSAPDTFTDSDTLPVFGALQAADSLEPVDFAALPDAPEPELAHPANRRRAEAATRAAEIFERTGMLS
jgi:hypothetical protein